MKNLTFVFLAMFSLSVFSQNKILPSEVQIKTAVLAAPKMLRDSSTVLGYNNSGKFVTLRKGTNHLICLADDPNKEGISIACYGEELEPFMSRGRQLIAEGKSEIEKRETRKKEIDNGSLKMPSEPSILYVVTGEEKDYNPETGDLENSRIRYAIYKPYMTSESTGLPIIPDVPGMPWLMEAGTHRSHIMITPIKN